MTRSWGQVTELNVPLLRKTMEHIETHRRQWRQEHYALADTLCGTTYCFAGRAIELAGHTVAWKDWGSFHEAFETSNGEHIKTVAARELGLTEEQAEQLFDAENDLPRLRRLVDKLIAEAESETTTA